MVHLVEDSILWIFQQALRFSIRSLYCGGTFNLMSTNCIPLPNGPPCSKVYPVCYVSHLRINIASQCFRLNCKLGIGPQMFFSFRNHLTGHKLRPTWLHYTSPARGHITWPAASAAAIQNRNEGDHKEVTSTAAASTASSSYSLRR